MIEPETCGAQLVAQLDRRLDGDRAPVLWRLGQAGFAVRMGTTLLFIDLYLSNHCEAVLARPFDHRRMSRAPLDPAEITMADAVLCTHDHPDHLDPPTMRSVGSASPAGVAVAPASARNQLLELDWPADRIAATRAGDHVQVGDVDVEAFAVAHEQWDVDPELGNVYQGYVLRHDGLSVAHVGDAVATPEMTAVLAAIRPDVLLVPINGRDETRAAMGFAGNLTAEEAVDLAIEVGARTTIPMHYDMFEQNVDEDALGRFVRAADRAAVDVAVLDIGARHVVATKTSTRTSS